MARGHDPETPLADEVDHLLGGPGEEGEAAAEVDDVDHVAST
jgi:hypothetical protein